MYLVYVSDQTIPIFFENFVDYDIVCFTEAKIDESDIVLFPGFTAFYQPKKQTFLRKSGGVVVYVKDSLAKFVSEIVRIRLCTLAVF